MDTTGGAGLWKTLRAIAAVTLAGVMSSCGGGDDVSSPDAKGAAQVAAAIQTRVVWNPAVLRVTVLQGTSQLSTIQLNVSQRIDNASLFVVPEIAGLVQVSLSGQTVLSPGVPINVSVELSVPGSTAPGLYEGTVHVRSGTRTVPATLKVQIQVVQGSSQQVVGNPTDPSPDRIARSPSGQFLVKDEVLVVVSGDAAGWNSKIVEIATSAGALIIGSVPELPVFQLRFVGADVGALEKHRDDLRSMPGVKAVSLNLFGAGLRDSDEGLFAGKWNKLGKADGSNRHLEFIRAPQAWDTTTGADGKNGKTKVRVAVIDSDFDYAHKDLANNIDHGIVNGNNVPLFTRPKNGNSGGHGTGVAGTICAEGENGFGVVGVAWHCELLLYSAKAATWCNPSTPQEVPRCLTLYGTHRVVDGMKNAVKDKASVANISLGLVESNCGSEGNCSNPPPLALVTDVNNILKEAFAYDKKKTVLWVVAAGNEGRSSVVQSPASFPLQFPEFKDQIIVVAGADIPNDGPVGSGSLEVNLVVGTIPNTGSNFGRLVDVAAPWEVATTLPRYCGFVGIGFECDDVTTIQFGSSTSYTEHFGGTSAAAPQVSGLAVLVLSAHASKSAAEVKLCIVNAARDYGASVKGNDFHVINAEKAVECAASIAPPVIPAAQPADLAVQVGQTATFSVIATSAATPTYQWRRGTSDISGATGASYTTPATTLADNGAIYSVVVTNVAGASVSRGAVLTVSSPVVGPTIVAPPQSTAVSEGATATFNVSATGSAPLSYQWRRNGVDVTCAAGANCPTYTTPVTALSDNGARFSVTVSNGAGSITSTDAVLTVNSRVLPPVVTSVSVDPIAPVVGSSATFSVNGTNLQPGYTLSLAGCAATELASASTTQRQFACTLTTAGSNLTGTVTVPSGTAIYSFVVTVGTAPPLPQAALSIGLGYAHTCGVTAAGVLKCWGNNREGELGDGTGTQQNAPVIVLGLARDVVAVASGPFHACALTSLGGVKCWGYNTVGQLGDGTQIQRLSPVDVVGLSSGVIAISVGTDHTCAVTTSGGVKCWGGHGPDVGAPIFTSHFTPVDVLGLSGGVTAIALGNQSSCALTSAGGVKCWGYNNKGQIGGGTTYQSAPFDIAGLSSNVTAIDAGYEHFCALTSAGGVKCWGDNFFGKLGNGASGVLLAPSSTPLDVVGLTQGVVSVAAGDDETCAVTSAGAVMCWGDDGTGTRVRSTPVAVVGLSAGVVKVDVGHGHVCAVISAGGLKCWQANNLGQVGDGTSNNYRPSPVDVVGF